MKKFLFFISIAAQLHVNSQVFTAGAHLSVYKDIVPDTLINYVVYPYTHEVYSFDLFDDTAKDIAITADGSVSPGGTSAAITAYSFNKNVFLRFGRLDSTYIPAYSYWDVTKVAQPLKFGDTINATSAVWMDTTLLYLTDHSGYGNANKNVNDWIGGDKYLAMKYENGNMMAYGWIRLNCPAKDSCYIKDYSYSAFSAGLAEKKSEAVNLFPNPTRDILHLYNGQTIFSGIKITDLYGREIAFHAEKEASGIRIRLGDQVPDGCYLFSCWADEVPVFRKIVKSKQVN